VKKLVLTGALAFFGVVAPLGAVGMGTGGPAGAAHVAQSRSHVIYNVPPLLGKHILSIGLGRFKNMTQTSSTNWSGYANIQDTYSTVSGSWTEPSVTCAAPSTGLLGLFGGGSASYSSFWVGIDGYTSSSVEQTGTSADCLSSGQPSYYAWYEMFPAGETSLSTTQYPVSPGDVMTGSVTSTSSSSFTMKLIDGPLSSPKWTFTLTVNGSQSLARSSAEWVAEAPSSCTILFCSALPLANFGTVNFTGASATNTSGRTGAIPAFTDAEITMQSNGTVKAQPGPLNSTGTGFSVNFDHS
jgi:hypothetical protein